LPNSLADEPEGQVGGQRGRLAARRGGAHGSEDVTSYELNGSKSEDGKILKASTMIPLRNFVDRNVQTRRCRCFFLNPPVIPSGNRPTSRHRAKHRVHRLRSHATRQRLLTWQKGRDEFGIPNGRPVPVPKLFFSVGFLLERGKTPARFTCPSKDVFRIPQPSSLERPGQMAQTSHANAMQATQPSFFSSICYITVL